MTIEELALKTWGEAKYPEQAIWILKNGVMINGFQHGTMRDVDHAEIGQFFKTSKYHEPGSNYLYICKFIRRGNIRTSFDGNECFFQLPGVPDKSQWKSMLEMVRIARRRYQPVLIEYLVPRGEKKRCWDFQEYKQHLARYAPHVLS